MYLIVDKATQAILHMSNSYPGEDRKPQDLMPGFDAATMAFGRAPEQFIPARFTIEDGVVKDLDAPPTAAAAAAETLAQARARKLREFDGQALALRAKLAPDHELLNAGIGLYDDAKLQSLRATVNAFRDEYHRLEAAVAKAKTIAELDALKPNFPSAVVAVAPPAPPAAAAPAKAAKSK